MSARAEKRTLNKRRGKAYLSGLRSAIFLLKVQRENIEKKVRGLVDAGNILGRREQRTAKK